MWNPIERIKNWARIKILNEIEIENTQMSEQLNAQRLNVVISISTAILERCKDDYTPIFTYIKIFSDKMVLDGIVDLLSSNKRSPIEGIPYFFIDNDYNKKTQYKIRETISKAFEWIDVPIHTSIDLSTSPIINFPWSHKRLIRSFIDIGTPDNPWEEDFRNHDVRLVLPMGLTYVVAGTHSTFTGMMKRKGIIDISPDSHHHVMDISSLFSILRFNGTNYIIEGTDEIAGTSTSFEFGCIFEIGRLLYQRGICYKNLI